MWMAISVASSDKSKSCEVFPTEDVRLTCCVFAVSFQGRLLSLFFQRCRWCLCQFLKNWFLARLLSWPLAPVHSAYLDLFLIYSFRHFPLGTWALPTVMWGFLFPAPARNSPMSYSRKDHQACWEDQLFDPPQAPFQPDMRQLPWRHA